MIALSAAEGFVKWLQCAPSREGCQVAGTNLSGLLKGWFFKSVHRVTQKSHF